MSRFWKSLKMLAMIMGCTDKYILNMLNRNKTYDFPFELCLTQIKRVKPCYRHFKSKTSLLINQVYCKSLKHNAYLWLFYYIYYYVLTAGPNETCNPTVLNPEWSSSFVTDFQIWQNSAWNNAREKVGSQHIWFVLYNSTYMLEMFFPMTYT